MRLSNELPGVLLLNVNHLFLHQTSQRYQRYHCNTPGEERLVSEHKAREGEGLGTGACREPYQLSSLWRSEMSSIPRKHQG